MIQLSAYSKPTSLRGAINTRVSSEGGDRFFDMWVCNHEHPDHLSAVKCAAEEMARRFPEADPFTIPERV
jgi:hypothetical protein